MTSCNTPEILIDVERTYPHILLFYNKDKA